MKNVLKFLISNMLVRYLVITWLSIVNVFNDLWSYLRVKALIKNSVRCSVHYSVEIKYGENITIGDSTLIGKYSCLGAMSPITIGNHVRISRGVIIETAGLNLSEQPPYQHNSKPIVIGDGVWIASNAIILGGVTIGENSIIGAGAVITKNIPSNSIVVGSKVRLLEKSTR